MASKYMKNVGKSVVYSSKQVLASKLPTLVAITSKIDVNAIKSNIEAGTSYRDKIQEAITKNSYVKDVKKILDNAKEDLKSGNFNNQEREMKSSLEAMMLSMGVDMGDFGDLFDSTSADDLEDDSFGLTSNQDDDDDDNYLETFAEKISKDNSNAMRGLGNTISSTSEYLGELNIALHSSSVSTQLASHSQTMALLGNIQTITKGIYDFNSTVMTEHINNTNQFYDDLLGETRKTNELLSELVESSSRKATSTHSDRNTKTVAGASKIFSSSSGLDIDEYIENIKGNFKRINNDKFGGITGSQLSALLAMSKGSPVAALLTMGMSQLFSKKTNDQFKKLDSAAGGLFTSFVMMMNDWSKKSGQTGMVDGVKSIIGELFGVRGFGESRVRLSDYRSREITADMELMSHKSITEVIPTYLAKILEAQTGILMNYNYATGHFVDTRKIRKELDEDLLTNKVSTFKDTRKYLKSKGGDFDNDDLSSMLSYLGSFSGLKDIKLATYSDMKKKGLSLNKPEHFSRFISIINGMGILDKLTFNKERGMSFDNRSKRNQEFSEMLQDTGYSSMYAGLLMADPSIPTSLKTKLANKLKSNGIEASDKDIIFADEIIKKKEKYEDDDEKGLKNRFAKYMGERNDNSDLSSKIKDLMAHPKRFIGEAMKSFDKTIYKVVYGTDDPDAGKKGMVGHITEGISTIYDSMKTKVDKSIIQPIHNKLFGDKGMLSSNEWFKEAKGFLPKSVLGILGGAVGASVLSINPIFGAFIGTGIAFANHSEKIKSVLFGKLGEDGIRDESGMIPKEFQDIYKKYAPKTVKGAGLGLVGSLFLPGGPVFGSLIGSVLGAVSETDRFKDFMWGKEGPDGKRTGGQYSKFTSFMDKNLFKPFKGWLSKSKDNVVEFWKEAISKPFLEGMEPMKKSFTKIGDMLVNKFKSIGDGFKSMFDGIFQEAVGKPFGVFVEDHILGPIKKKLGSIMRVIGSFLGSVISAPIKVVTKIAKAFTRDMPDKPKPGAAPEEVLQNVIGDNLGNNIYTTNAPNIHIGGYEETPRTAPGLHPMWTATAASDELVGKKRVKATRATPQQMRKIGVRVKQSNVITPSSVDNTPIVDAQTSQSISKQIIAHRYTRSLSEEDRAANESMRADVSDIARNTNNIYEQIKDQINGVGYNMEYIRNILEEHFGSPKQKVTGKIRSAAKKIKGVFGLLLSPFGYMRDKITDAQDRLRGGIRGGLMGGLKALFGLFSKKKKGSDDEDDTPGSGRKRRNILGNMFDSILDRIFGREKKKPKGLFGRLYHAFLDRIFGKEKRRGGLVGFVGSAIVDRIFGKKKRDRKGSLADLLVGFIDGVKKVGKSILDFVTAPFKAVWKKISDKWKEKNNVMKVRVVGGYLDAVDNVYSIGGKAPIRGVDSEGKPLKLSTRLKNTATNVKNYFKGLKDNLGPGTNKLLDTHQADLQNASSDGDVANASAKMQYTQTMAVTEMANSINGTGKGKKPGIIDSILGMSDTVTRLLPYIGTMTAFLGKVVGVIGTAMVGGSIIEKLLPNSQTGGMARIPSVLAHTKLGKKMLSPVVEKMASKTLLMSMNSSIKPIKAIGTAVADFVTSPAKGKFIADKAMDIGSKLLTNSKAALVAGSVKGGTIGALSDAIINFITSPKVTRIFGEVGEKVIKKNASRIASSIVAKLAKKGAGMIAKLVARFSPVTIALAIYDVLSGMAEARNIFKLPPGYDPSIGMRVAAGLSKALSGILFSIIPFKWLAELIYGVIGKDDKKAELEEQQAQFKQDYDDYKQQNPNSDLSFDDYNNSKNKTVFSSIFQINKSEKKSTTEVISQSNYLSGDSGRGNGGTSSMSAPSTIQGQPYYNQNDKRWKDHPFGTYGGKTDTIGKGGCAPAVAAMAMTKLTGKPVSPVDAAVYAARNGYKLPNKGTIPDFFSSFASNYGYSFKPVRGEGESNVYDTLANNKPVIFMGRQLTAGYSPFGKNPHYVLGSNIDKDGNVLVLDPENKSKSGKYHISDLIDNSTSILTASKGVSRTRTNTMVSARGSLSEAYKNMMEDISLISQGKSPIHTTVSGVFSNLKDRFKAGVTGAIDAIKGFLNIPTGSSNINGMSVYPVDPTIKGLYISSKFGYRQRNGITEFHNGVDLAGGSINNSPCYAISAGKVVVSKFNKSYGNYIVIQHDGYVSLSAHLNSRRVSVGDSVSKGQQIGQVGNTGDSSGPHLHFEIRKGSYDSSFFSRHKTGQYKNSVDPVTFVPPGMSISSISDIGIDPNSKKGSFIGKIVGPVQRVSREYGIRPSITLAQAILESGWGDKSIGNNIFGIKATGWKGAKKSVWTSEYYDGKTKTSLVDEFRDYNSIEESIADHARILGTSKTYEKYRKASNYREAAQALQGTYATSPTYAKSLIDIIEQNNLHKFDNISSSSMGGMVGVGGPRTPSDSASGGRGTLRDYSIPSPEKYTASASKALSMRPIKTPVPTSGVNTSSDSNVLEAMLKVMMSIDAKLSGVTELQSQAIEQAKNVAVATTAIVKNFVSGTKNIPSVSTNNSRKDNPIVNGSSQAKQKYNSARSIVTP